MIQENFEPVWESVGPVPRVSIDFGNGRKIERTMNGNIATYVCFGDGRVFDILPGAYDPETYVSQLRLLADAIRELPQDPATRLAAIQQYHRKAALDRGMSAARAASPGEPVVLPAASIPAAIHAPSALASSAEQGSDRSAARRARIEKAVRDLRIDAEVNETQRRPMIHARLAEQPPPAVSELYRWLYREVLDTNLDEPYLGWGHLVSRDDPFTE
jgi:hypothetical protein